MKLSWKSKLKKSRTSVIIWPILTKILESCHLYTHPGIYILDIPPPRPGGGGIFVQFEKQGRIWRRTWKKERKRGKRRKKEKSDKTHVKIPLWSLNDRKKSTKTGKNFRGGGGKNFSDWPEYIPLLFRAVCRRYDCHCPWIHLQVGSQHPLIIA